MRDPEKVIVKHKNYFLLTSLLFSVLFCTQSLMSLEGAVVATFFDLFENVSEK